MTGKNSVSANIDQQVLDRIIKEVFEKINSSRSEIPVEKNSEEHGVASSSVKIPVGISVRHVHLSQEDLNKLFGENSSLHPMKDLYQPGSYAAQETVALIGPKTRLLEKVRVLGPLRSKSQVEIAKTDAVFLGVNAPVRVSGDIKGSAPITIIGPKGVVELKEGCIRAMRHLHMNSKEAASFGLKNGDFVKLRFGGPNSVTFDNVVVRIDDSTKLEVHLDTDEGNVADIHCNQQIEIIKDEEIYSSKIS